MPFEKPLTTVAPARTSTAVPPSAEGPIRVLLVDDSSVVRHLLSELFRSEPDFEVVGKATNGREAIDLIDTCKPHVVILDVEMPVLNGIETLGELRPRWPKLPVIMFSTLTERGAAATLDALSAGANDYSTKPSNSRSLADSLDAVRSHLVPLVKTWGGIGRRRADLAERAEKSAAAGDSALSKMRHAGAILPLERSARPGPNVVLRPPPLRRPRIDAIVIGSSTGGPNALAELVPELPADLPVPVLLVQHMPELFTQLLASRLDGKSKLTVVEAAPGMVLERGSLYLAKGGIHMVVKRSGTKVVVDYDDGPPENSCKPSVDVMFRSAVSVWGGAILGVMLTGMGQDGLIGSTAIDAAGGAIVTQDEESSVVWGMPGAVATAGLSSENLPLDKIVPAIVRRVGPGAALWSV